MPVGGDVSTQLGGYFPSDFKQPTEFAQGFPEALTSRVNVTSGVFKAEPMSHTILDARGSIQQDLSEKGAKESFDARAFACLSHKSRCTDWHEDYFKGMFLPRTNEIFDFYAKEVEGIIRNTLLPEYHIILVDPHRAVLRRGPGSNNNFYGTGVHQDYGVTMEDVQENIACYDTSGYMVKQMKEQWDQKDVTGFMMINFWRPVDMKQPLEYKPLAFCDPNSVNPEDCIFTGLDAGHIGGSKGKLSNQMALKYNPDHKWYYYSKMTNDEVLIFKQFEFWKGDSTDRLELPVRSVFHSAFDDPNTPEDAEKRTSTEYRVPVWLGKKRTPDEMAQQIPWQPPNPYRMEACGGGCSPM